MRHIDSLTSLRFFAAFAVLLHHMQFMQTSSDPDVRALYSVFHEGLSGVQFFYILSGFIICYSFSARQREGRAAFSYFLYCRAARLFPLHWLTLAASIVMFHPWDGQAVYLIRLLANLSLLHAWSTDVFTYFSFNGVSWSISVEMFFYLSFCLLVGLPTRVLVFILTAIVAVVFIQLQTPQPDGTVGLWLFYVNPVMRLADFLAGMIVYRAFVSHRWAIPAYAVTAAEIASIAGIGLCVFLAPMVAGQLGLDLYYVPSMALAIFVFAHGTGSISRALSWPPLVLLGNASFALYMVHQMVIARYLQWQFDTYGTNQVIDNWGALQILAITGTIAIALAIALHLLFEKPTERFLRKMWKARPHGTSAQSAPERLLETPLAITPIAG